jgi:type I restriction enzyme S subunit
VLDVADIDHKMPEAQVSGIPYISPLNFTETGIDFESAKHISEEDYERLSKKCKPEKEDIIFPRYGTIGVLRFIEIDIKFLVSYSSCVVKTSKMNTYPKYIFYALQSPHTKLEINKYINKTTQPNVGMHSIKQFLFPLPPLEEQKRIVARLETVLELIEKTK